MRRAFASAALTAVTLTAVTLAVDHSRDGVEPVAPELSAARPASPPIAVPAPVPAQPSPPAQPSQPSQPPKAAAKPVERAAPARPARAPAVAVGRKVMFVADYETGDFSQWGTCQSALLNNSCSEVPRGGDRTMQVVKTAAPDGGRYAARFVVRDGDVPEFGGGERSEVSENDPNAVTNEGDERWYEWSMRMPDGFTNPTGGWFIVMQWHSGSGSPPLAIDISKNGTVDIGGDGSGEARKTIGPVRRGQWVNYVLHVGFSGNRDTGFVEAWENGKKTVPKTHRATMSDGENYLKQGIYRDEGAGDGPTEVEFAGLRVTAP